MERPPRIYADTSVFGGCFDRGFERESRRFFELASAGRVQVLVSSATEEELETAPVHVRRVFQNLPSEQVFDIEVNEGVRILAVD